MYILLWIDYDRHKSFHFDRAILSTHNIFLNQEQISESCKKIVGT